MFLLGRLVRRPFSVVFGLLLAAALAVALSHRVGPGQDFHYHAMAARIAARVWIGDPAYAALYAKVNPLDSNALLYVLAFPFELVLPPLVAMRVATALIYFVGYPLACAAALRIAGRSPWGAVLAIPLAYNWAWVSGGFLPFCTSAPLFILVVVLLSRAIEGELPRRRLAWTAGAAVLLCLAHAHVYAWTMILFGAFTFAIGCGRVAVGIVRGVRGALRESVRMAARMLAIVGPSLLLFGWWWLRARRFAPAEPVDLAGDSFHVRVARAHTFLALTKDGWEFALVGLLAVAALAGMLFAGRPKRARLPLIELAFLLSVLSYLFFPATINGQGIAPRQFDMAMWLLPLVVYAHPPGRGAAVRHGFVVASFIAFAAVRLGAMHRSLGALDEEYAGLFEIARKCPPDIGRDGRRAAVAYATMNMFSKHFWSGSFHQPFESLAILCSLDAPVRDTRVYPYNLSPLRYNGAPSAPPTMIVGNARWYEEERLWDAFEYVLVHRFTPTAEDAERIAAHADTWAASGEWTLYRSR